MKTRLYIVLCIAFIIQMAGVLPLQAGHYYYKQISLKEGLPSTVRCILTDEQGFVWIGTRSGLGRFDGHELKKYTHQANDPHSLPHDLILQIVEDRQYNVWILTDKGVARYQRQSDDFYLPTDEKGKNITAYSACTTPDGILFGAKNKIYFYNYRDASFRLLQEFNQTDLPNFNVTILSLWDEHTALCCSRWQGLLLLDLKTGKCSRPPFDCGKEIMSMIIDSKNRIWIAPYNNGLYCFDRNGKQLASYTTHNSSLSNNVILSLAERENKLWIGTDGGGINVLEPETGQLSLLEHIPGRDNYSLPANSILCLYNDQNNNNNNNNNDIIITQSSIEMSNNETTSAADTESTTSAVTESTTSSTTSAAQVSGGVARITTKAEIQEYTSRSNYDDAVFFGDMIVSGIGEYGYLDTSRIFSDNNLTTDKALNSVSSVAAANPSKVYVLVGLNDLNYGTRSGENVAERIGSIVESLKEAIPSVKVYVVSLLPITQSFEAKSNVKITQAAIDEANSTLAARATEYGMTFIDIADAFKDESGYLNTDVSTGGYNLNHNYYPFFLNNISGASN